jgi:hypothetical protein
MALTPQLNSQLPAAPKATAANKGLAKATFGGLGVTFLNQDTVKFGQNATAAQAKQDTQRPEPDMFDIMQGLGFLQNEMARVLQSERQQQFAGRQQQSLARSSAAQELGSRLSVSA